MIRKHTTSLLTAAAMLLIAAPPAWPQGDPSPNLQLQQESSLVDLLHADGLTREQLVGLYRALAGNPFQPPACVAGQEMFTDVPSTNQFCPWIEELARRGITTGCTATKYCPGSPVNRGQMAVFVVRAMEACPTLDPTDEMARVGGICIDKYEASVWDAPVGGNRLEDQAQIRELCPDDGQDCKGKIFARSVGGVPPASRITWFQAQQALANSGKRLPTNAEWQSVVSGTPDGAPCDISGVVQNTGAIPGCVSEGGVFDMVGNVWEWVADWVPLSEGCGEWSNVGEFSSENWMCLLGASHPATGPGALIRGGRFYFFFGAGPFAVRGDYRPSDSDFFIGFRGAR